MGAIRRTPREEVGVPAGVLNHYTLYQEDGRTLLSLEPQREQADSQGPFWETGFAPTPRRPHRFIIVSLTGEPTAHTAASGGLPFRVSFPLASHHIGVSL